MMEEKRKAAGSSFDLKYFSYVFYKLNLMEQD